jgi:pimeloyl-ACP methyl ester carboxylesterase
VQPQLASPLNFYETGQPSTQALVLLHPGGVGPGVWLPFARQWSTDYHVIAPDLNGLGDAPFSTRRLSQAVLDLLQRKQITSATVIGSSLGANVALQLAAQAPSAVKCFVADSAQAGGEPVPAPARTLISVVNRLAGVMPTGLYANLLMAQFKAYSDADRVTIRREINTLGTSAFFKAIQATFDHDVRAELTQMRMPVLLTNGRNDPVLPQSQKLKSQLPQAEHFILDQAGHSAFLSQHLPFLQKVTEFIKTTP